MQVGPLSLVELQRGGERVQDAVGDTTQAAALKLGVVVDANAGEQGNLLPPKTSDPSSGAVGRKASLLRRGFARRLARKSRISFRFSTASTLRRLPLREEGSVSTWLSRASLTGWIDGWLVLHQPQQRSHAISAVAGRPTTQRTSRK